MSNTSGSLFLILPAWKNEAVNIMVIKMGTGTVSTPNVPVPVLYSTEPTEMFRIRTGFNADTDPAF